MIIKFLVFLLFSTSLMAFDKDLTTINDRVPLEFNLLFDSLKQEVKTQNDKARMIELCKDLNTNLGFLQKPHIYMLMKTEVIKNTLEHKFDKVRQFDINNALIKRLEDDFNRKKPGLNRFAQWIWQSILAELHKRQKDGLISANSFNAGNFEGNKRAEALRFQRYLNYLLPWIDRMDGLEAPEFNKLATAVSWQALERINERSLLFKRYASTATSDTQVTLFNIPQKLLEITPEARPVPAKDQTPLTLKEESEKAKTEAQTEIDKVTPLDMSTLSDDVARELENKTTLPPKGE